MVSGLADSTWITPIVVPGRPPALKKLLSNDKVLDDTANISKGVAKVSFATPLTGWVAGSSGCFSTTDGGATWTTLTLPGSHGVSAPNASANESEPISSNQSNTTAVQPDAFAAAMALPSAPISQHLGFDKSLVLASSQMATWWQSSPYYDVGFLSVQISRDSQPRQGSTATASGHLQRINRTRAEHPAEFYVSAKTQVRLITSVYQAQWQYVAFSSNCLRVIEQPAVRKPRGVFQ